MNSKELYNLKKSKKKVRKAPCNKYNQFSIEYEEYKKRQPKILASGKKGDRRKKNIYCRKKKNKILY